MKSGYKLIGRIVLMFFLLYFLLSGIYQSLLLHQTPDFFTFLTAKQVNLLYRLTGYPTNYVLLSNPAEIGIMLDNRWLVKIVEGCNGASVLIVFWSFVWAFPGHIRSKLIFSLLGALSVWLINLIRIYALGLIYLHRPGLFDFTHRVLFPASVYAWVVLLWFLWIRYLLRSSSGTSHT